MKTILLIALSFFLVPDAGAACTRIYFDTGETLISVPPDYKNMTNKPGLEDYLESLEEGGYELGLIVNVPEDWGNEIDVKDPLTRRFLYTQQFFTEGWKAGTDPFPWQFFGKVEGEGRARVYKGHAFFPFKNTERKPGNCESCVLNRAYRAAKDAGCRAVYLGEDAAEMAAAEQIGFIPFQVGHSDAGNFFLPLEKIQGYIKGYKPGRWKEKQ